MSDPKGRVVLLVGPSCAGKSTLARALQAASPTPFLGLSLDGLFAGVPDRWGGQGDLAHEGFRYDWIRGGPGQPGAVRKIACGAVGRRMLRGLHRSVAIHAALGTDVVVDDMLLDAGTLADWAEALAATPTFLVRLTAPLKDLIRREQARTLHPTPGLTEGHYALHEALAADLVIDTSIVSPEAAAGMILETPVPAPGAGTLSLAGLPA